MPIPYYQLDDRKFDDLVKDLVNRIPAHTPEWTNPQIGDPGRTLIDLFAWLGDSILYRANLLPERQRLEFLRLLNIPMKPSQAAHGLVSLEVNNEKLTSPVKLSRYTEIHGAVNYETTKEVTVLPIVGRVYAKRKPTEAESQSLSVIQSELDIVYNINIGNSIRQDEKAYKSNAYVTTPLFNELPLSPDGFDFARDTVDRSIWIALLGVTDDPARLNQVKMAFKADQNGAQILNIGIEPRITVPEFAENIHRKLHMNDLWQWEMPSNRDSISDNYLTPYQTLLVKDDSTDGFTRQGLVKLMMPDPDQIHLPDNNIDDNIYAGTGNHPPRIDDEKVANRLITWIRLRPKTRVETLNLSWLGVNATTIDQRSTVQNVVLGTSQGNADMRIQLPGTSVDAESFELQVEASGQGYQSWHQYPLHAASMKDIVYELDAEAGVVTFGDSLRGMVPQAGSRVRIKTMRYGGGHKGNILAGNLTKIAHPQLKILQPIAIQGGTEAETLEQAEKRIPAVLKHSHHTITQEDYKQLALETPAVELGRVEVLPKFKPQQRLDNVLGVISVMVLPVAQQHLPPNPRPDRNILSAVHSYLEERRPIGVELYVISTEYVPIGLSIAIDVRDGFPHNKVTQNVIQAMRDFLWPLSPGGHNQQGWPLGKEVKNQELEVMIARVAGVLAVNDINLFGMTHDRTWQRVNDSNGFQQISLLHWQLPELLSVVVHEGKNAVNSLDDYYETGVDTDGTGGAGGVDGGTSGGEDGTRHIPIPVVPEICK